MGAYYASFETDEGDGGITINNSYDMRLVKNNGKTIILGNHFDGENVKYVMLNRNTPINITIHNHLFRTKLRFQMDNLKLKEELE